MKVLCAVLIAVLSFFTPAPSYGSSLPDEGPVVTYALLKSEATLCSDTLLSRAVTTLPATYFVIVLEPGTDYMRVSYYDITGYINPACAEIVDYEPVTKFATVFRFTVNNDGYPATLRSAPDHNASNKLAEIPNSSGGMYYGSAIGTAIIPEAGNLWYYVKYDGEGGTAINGYVYKTQVKIMPIENNKIEKVVKEKTDPSPKSPFEFDDMMSVLIILALSIPAVLIMLLIFRKKPPRRSPRFKKDD